MKPAQGASMRRRCIPSDIETNIERKQFEHFCVPFAS
jgi:hypothetical protein